jgi:hypothetical protein
MAQIPDRENGRTTVLKLLHCVGDNFLLKRFQPGYAPIAKTDLRARGILPIASVAIIIALIGS